MRYELDNHDWAVIKSMLPNTEQNNGRAGFRNR
jgi:hypothetical protein